ncbi:MAG: hypothetical protein K1X50_14130 [Candidatus Promineofilum sp.]|nr:hypothetical protein [Promineifilum sp.]MCW5865030.1 PD40 domain-containing protein [Anaerolineae bacterium]
MTSKIARLSVAVVMFALAMVAQGCSSNADQRNMSQIAALDGEYFLMEVLPDGKLLVAGEESDTSDAERSGLYVLDNQQLDPLALPKDAACVTGTHYSRPGLLPDGRLGLVKFCVDSLSEPLADRGDHTLVAFDLSQHTVMPVMDGFLYPGLQQSFTWNQDMSRGVMAVGTLDSTLYWLSPDGPEPMQVVVGEGEAKWSLAEALKQTTCTRRCEPSPPPVGIARTPSWSPNGTTIAFTASTTAMALQGLSRVNAIYSVYLMDEIEQKPRAVLNGLSQPRLLRWSPNGQQLLLDACIGLLRRCGLWTFNPQDGSLKQIGSRERYQGAGWLSESKIALAYCEEGVDNSCNQTLLYEYDLDE